MVLVFYLSCVIVRANPYSVQSLVVEVFGLFISFIKEENRFSEVTFIFANGTQPNSLRHGVLIDLISCVLFLAGSLFILFGV